MLFRMGEEMNLLSSAIVKVLDNKTNTLPVDQRMSSLFKTRNYRIS